MSATAARYCVVIEEVSPVGGWVVRRMLVGRFVSKGDAVAYAMWRRDTTPADKGWQWVVETVNANRALYAFTATADMV